MNRVAQGNADVSEVAPGHWRLQVDGTTNQYSNAQLDDYHHLQRQAYPWAPPMRLVLWAKGPAAHQGTWGFGWWNAPYSPLTSALPARPASVWFFGNGKGNMAWTPHSRATGFKAASLETRTWQSIVIAPFTPLIMLVNRHPRIYRWLWSRLMPHLHLHEMMIAIPDDSWHRYQIDWHADSVTWSVDDSVIAHASHAPHGPLGLCIWIDNQWLTASPDGQFGWGLTEAQSTLEVRDITISDLRHAEANHDTPSPTAPAPPHQP